MKILIIQILNYTLSFLMWMIVGRAILTRIIGDRRNLMLAAFIKITDPVYGVTRRVLPFAKEGWVPFVSIILIIVIRLAIILIFQPGTHR